MKVGTIEYTVNLRRKDMNGWEELDMNDMPRDILKDGVYEFMSMKGCIVFVPDGSVDRTELWDMILFDVLSGDTVFYRKREKTLKEAKEELLNAVYYELKPMLKAMTDIINRIEFKL